MSPLPIVERDNRWLKIRIALLCVFFLGAFVNGYTLGFVTKSMPPADSILSLIPAFLILPAISTWVTLRRERKRNTLLAPDWRESPFQKSEPLQFFHFAGFFFLSVGIGTAFGAALSGEFMSVLPAIVLVAGAPIGVALGILLAIKFSNPRA